MEETNTLAELYKNYVLLEMKDTFISKIKLPFYKMRLKRVIRNKLGFHKMAFIDYQWVLDKLSVKGKSNIININTGLNQYDCRINNNDGMYILTIEKYEYNLYKQKLDLTDVKEQITFSVPDKHINGEIRIKLNTGYKLYEGVLSNIPVFEPDTDYFMQYLRQWKPENHLYGTKINPVNAFYYIPLHTIMKGLIYKVFELEE